VEIKVGARNIVSGVIIAGFPNDNANTSEEEHIDRR